MLRAEQKPTTNNSPQHKKQTLRQKLPPLAVNQGTLYPLLLKLEQEGAIASEWPELYHPGAQPEEQPQNQGL